MEAPDYLHAGYYIGVSGGMGPQPPPEKHGDHFVVEDLFDFSNEDDDEEEAFVSGAVADEAGYDAAGGSSGDSSSASVVAAVESCNSSLSGFGARVPGEFDLSGELGEPHDELAELEWLSNIVEESFSSEDLEKLQLISGVKSSPASSAAAAPPRFFPETPVPGKARSKRSRIAPCDWSSRLLAFSPVPPSDAPAKKAPKPAKKRDPSEGPRYAVADGRRCLHCETDKTPQWRTGPMGPKTLCNACGVRYKSGRLVPEYRPAASPTFMMSMHSNSHRKVLELRRQKEVMQQQLLVSSDCGAGAGDDFLIHHRAGPDFRQLM